MDALGGKEVYYFLQNVFEKRKGLLFWRVIIRMTSPGGCNLGTVILDISVSVLRIRGEGGRRVARHLYLRNDRDKPIRGVRNDLPNIVLRKVATVRFAIAQAGIAEHRGVSPLGADLGQKRIFLYLDAPALVISQMQVQDVQFMSRHEV